MSLLNAPLQSYFYSFFQHTYEVVAPILTTSKIPIFIKDINHPWVNENLQWLENRHDPFQELCDPNSELYREIDGRVCPPDLFNRLEINNDIWDNNGWDNGWDTSRTPWRNARERLREMRDCPMALDSVKHLYVDIYVSDGTYGSRYDSPNPGDDIPDLFADVLTLMHNLERIDWKISEESTDYFEKAFSEKNLSLPSVIQLIPSQSSFYLIPMCPNLRELEAKESTNTQKLFIESTSKVPSIQSLKYEAAHRWTEPLLSEEEKLQMVKKDLNLEPDDIIIIQRPNDPYLKILLRELVGYPNIRHLELPWAGQLSLGFDGGPMCGNAYFGPEGRAYHRRVIQTVAETEEKAVRIALSVLPHLESISIGESTPHMIKEDGKKVIFEWPWTGRMEEWLLEQVPDVAEDDPYYDAY
ncbi:uncharacterized protein Triagg1_1393 [Trichoderma aggressivum f. europaeum]|uniref:Uncharacterized protein n=1 Tax=Trichoderma aggressivum f. europaeum TaxID=173218 RepID=A0AAE1IKP1_9HYPO|nr:hypothetical protein Triagg1_1393 [Trichoderma aggressivum f. europaeum]